MIPENIEIKELIPEKLNELLVENGIYDVVEMNKVTMITIDVEKLHKLFVPKVSLSNKNLRVKIGAEEFNYDRVSKLEFQDYETSR